MRVQLVGAKTFATLKAVYHEKIVYDVSTEVGENLLAEVSDTGEAIFIEGPPIKEMTPRESVGLPSEDAAPKVKKKIVLGAGTTQPEEPAPEEKPTAPEVPSTVTEV